MVPSSPDPTVTQSHEPDLRSVLHSECEELGGPRGHRGLRARPHSSWVTGRREGGPGVSTVQGPGHLVPASDFLVLLSRGRMPRSASVVAG